MEAGNSEPCLQLRSIVTADSEGRIVNCNVMACQVFGYPRTELIGQNVSMLMPAPFCDQHQHYVDRFLSTGHARVLDKRIIVNGLTKNRTAIPLAISMSIISLEEERFFLALLEPLEELVAVVVCDRDGTIASASGNCSAVLCCDAQVLIGKNLSLLLPEWSHGRIRSSGWTKLLSSRRRSTEPTQVFVCQFGSHFCNVKVEQRGKEFVASFQGIMSPVLNFTLDMEGTILSVTDGYQALLGYSLEEMIGTNVQDILMLNEDMFRPAHHPSVVVSGASGREMVAAVDIEAFYDASNTPRIRVRIEVLNQNQQQSSQNLGQSLQRKKSLGLEMVDFLEEHHLGYYKVGEALGEGFFGKVRKGVHSLTKMPVAIKMLSRSHYDEVGLSFPPREVEILRHLNHPNIVALYEVVATADSAILIEEFIPGGELFALVESRPLVEAEARSYFSDLVDAVGYLHHQGIAHRDLKLENCMMSGHHVKLIDFGLSAFCDKKPLTDFCGSPDYAAPEVFLNIPYDGAPADVWSLGVILFIMLTQFLPFHTPARIVTAEYSWPGSCMVSVAVRELVSQVFQAIPSRRLTSAEIRKHSWLAATNETRSLDADDLEAASSLPFRFDVLAIMHDDLGMDPNLVTASLQAHSMNQLTATYKLLERKFPTHAPVTSESLQRLLRALECHKIKN